MLEPVMLHNPTNEQFEVMSGGVVYIFEAKQSRIVQGDTARQILKNQNTPLVQVNIIADVPVTEPEVVEVAEVSQPVVENKVDYSNMKYFQLRSIATAKGIFKVGMKGKELIKLLNAQRKAD